MMLWTVSRQWSIGTFTVIAEGARAKGTGVKETIQKACSQLGTTRWMEAPRMEKRMGRFSSKFRKSPDANCCAM